ncbi:NAC domain-containing protein 78-like [Bidens hawaiensis]|uniref:NAC domain-containing protein 78-like n=1 Tax=Bidens hawaiensis TaxID=980011 RepID=UPI00404B2E64
MASALAPGFRFHPTDEELVRYYLKRKLCGKLNRSDAIADVDVYKVEPWDLPGLSKIKTRDLEWYFFSVLDKKHSNGSKTNRATKKGYWKTTGKDRVVHHRSEQVGMKKTLVYHSGRAPKGERTNWVMHEYRLIDPDLQKSGIVQDAFVLCRIFHKSGSGPKNGERYGAPLIEDEWEDDELVFVPAQEDYSKDLPVDLDSYLDANDIDQILNSDISREDDVLPLIHGESYAAVTGGEQKPLVVAGEYDLQVDSSVQTEMGPGSVTNGYVGGLSNEMNFDMGYSVDEPYFDATDVDFPVDDSLFFQPGDVKNNVDMDYGLGIVNEYTWFFDSDVDNFQYTLQNVNDGTHEVNEVSLPYELQNDNVALSSKQEHPNQEADISHPYLKKASYMLGNIAAPPAFASEFPTKLASVSQAASSVNIFFNGGVVDLSLGKHTQLNIVFSFGSGQRVVNTHEAGKVNLGADHGWFYCAFRWAMVLCLSFKIGSLVFMS